MNFTIYIKLNYIILYYIILYYIILYSNHIIPNIFSFAPYLMGRWDDGTMGRWDAGRFLKRLTLHADGLFQVSNPARIQFCGVVVVVAPWPAAPQGQC